MVDKRIGDPKLVDDTVKDNYDDLHLQGRSWDQMISEAERMNDPHLAAHLRERAANDPDSSRDGGDQQQTRTAPPKDRTTGPKTTTGGSK